MTRVESLSPKIVVDAESREILRVWREEMKGNPDEVAATNKRIVMVINNRVKK